MSGAASAGQTLHTRIAAAGQAIKPVTTGWGQAVAAYLDSDDLVARLQGAASLVLAAEALSDAASNAVKQIRAALAETMADTGCTSFEIEGFLVSQRDPAQRAVVTDRAALPADVLIAQDPKPDIAEIGRRLKRGPVPGAEWSNGGAPSIAFTRRSA